MSSQVALRVNTHGQAFQGMVVDAKLGSVVDCVVAAFDPAQAPPLAVEEGADFFLSAPALAEDVALSGFV